MKRLFLFLITIFLIAASGAQSRIVYCDFSQMPDGNVFTNCTDLEAKGCDKNPYYKNSLRFLTEGSVLVASFNVSETKNKMELLFEHLSSSSQAAKNGGYLPMTVKINGNAVFTN